MSRVGAVFVSLSRRLASADSSVRSVLSTLSCNTTQRQVHRDSQATGALHCIPQFYRRGVREEIASEWARSYCTSSNFHRHHAVSEFPAMISITPSYALFGCAALSTQMGHITVPVGMSLNASAPTVLHPERVLVLLTTYFQFSRYYLFDSSITLQGPNIMMTLTTETLTTTDELYLFLHPTGWTRR